MNAMSMRALGGAGDRATARRDVGATAGQQTRQRRTTGLPTFGIKIIRNGRWLLSNGFAAHDGLVRAADARLLLGAAHDRPSGE